MSTLWRKDGWEAIGPPPNHVGERMDQRIKPRSIFIHGDETSDG